MSSLAQEESRSISENVTWGQRKRFSDGKVSMPYKQFLGYEKGEDGTPTVNQNEAETVRIIYKMFLEGKTTQGIANFLMEHGINSPSGKSIWRSSTIASILANEKYKGDALLQKKFTVDFLMKKMKTNEGEVPQYYVEHSHEAIIATEEFEAVQEEIARRKELGRAYSDKAFHSKIICGDCGGFYGRKVWHSTDEYKSVIFQCNQKFKNENKCKTPTLTEDEIKQRFLVAYSKLLSNRNTVLADCELIRQMLCDTTNLDADITKWQEEIEVVAELVRKFVSENASSEKSQDEYSVRYDSLVKRYEKAVAKRDAATAKQMQKAEQSKGLYIFIEALRESPLVLSTWDERLWITLIEKATIHFNSSITFTFKNGTEFEVKSER